MVDLRFTTFDLAHASFAAAIRCFYSSGFGFVKSHHYCLKRSRTSCSCWIKKRSCFVTCSCH